MFLVILLQWRRNNGSDSNRRVHAEEDFIPWICCWPGRAQICHGSNIALTFLIQWIKNMSLVGRQIDMFNDWDRRLADACSTHSETQHTSSTSTMLPFHKHQHHAIRPLLSLTHLNGGRSATLNYIYMYFVIDSAICKHDTNNRLLYMISTASRSQRHFYISKVLISNPWNMRMW